MNQTFVKVPNELFIMDEFGNTIVSELGEKCFIIWFYLKKTMAELNCNKMQISVSMIKRELGNRKGFSKLAIIRKYLRRIESLNLFIFEHFNSNTRSQDNFYIKDIDVKKDYQLISVDIFNDNINVIEATGLLTYCYLHKAHNKNFGGEQDGGYVEQSYALIGKILGMGKYKLEISLKILASVKLIKIKQGKFFINDVGKKRRSSNRYIVLPKIDVDNKYYFRK